MKPKTIFLGIALQALLLGILLLGSAAALSAQNTLPNPHDDSCWSSLSALRGCQIQAYDEAQAHAQDCTSYPEYQCFDYYQPHPKTAKAAVKADQNGGSTTRTDAATSSAASGSNVQTSTAR